LDGANFPERSVLDNGTHDMVGAIREVVVNGARGDHRIRRTAIPFARSCALLVLPLGIILNVGAAPTPSPALLVLNKAASELAIVDPQTNQVVVHIPVGTDPHEVVVSPDGRIAYTSSYGGEQDPHNTISVVDLVAQKELRRIDLGAMRAPHGLSYVGDKLYFTAEASKAVGRYDTASNQIDWIQGLGQIRTNMIVATEDGSHLFTSNTGSNNITAIERGASSTDWNLTMIPVGKGPEALELSPDGREVWTAHTGDGGISVVISVATKKVIATIDARTKLSNRLKLMPDGKLVLLSDLSGGQVLVIDAGARKVIKRVAMKGSPEDILIVPDGARAYVALEVHNRVDILDLKTLEVTGQIETGRGPDGMAWAVRR
jgi:YVTN family beta-propeller protein